MLTSVSLALGLVATPRSDLAHGTPARMGVVASACAVVAQDFEIQWGATGEWRAQAPYPAPHEVSPTNATGVWVERWKLAQGSVEIRQVSATETRIARIDSASCLPRVSVRKRTFDRTAVVNAFTDATLAALMQQHDRGVIYIWSPRMPLSIKGLVEARAAAQSMGVAFKAVVAEANDEELRSYAQARGNSDTVTSADVQRMEALELVYRNGTIHYPSLLVYRNGHVIDGVYPGYKNRETYAKYAALQFDSDSIANSSSRNIKPTDNYAPIAPKFWVDHKTRATTIAAVNTLRRIGFFFKPITGTSLVSYNARSVDYFFDMKTGKEIIVPGHIDPVPTPDGRFLTLPGLHFHRVPALVAGDVTPLFTDRELPDEYQTASILSESKTAVRYRVVTGWNAGARFRDYDVALSKQGVPVSVTAVGEPFVPCKERLLTLPINAKSGREFGAFDARAKTNLVLEVTNESFCTLKLDLGFASGKISFSYDGAFIAFATSRVNTEAEGELIRPSELFHKDALVLERKTGRIVSLSQNAAISGMTFPEFQKDGSVMLLDQYGPGRPVEQLRVVTFK